MLFKYIQAFGCILFNKAYFKQLQAKNESIINKYKAELNILKANPNDRIKTLQDMLVAERLKYQRDMIRKDLSLVKLKQENNRLIKITVENTVLLKEVDLCLTLEYHKLEKEYRGLEGVIYG